MMLNLTIAFRYLVSKKSVNAINIITAVTAVGITIGAAAFVILLSVFNGFEGFIEGMYGKFNPDVKIEAKQGKVFVPDSTMLHNLAKLPEVAEVCPTLEETALFVYENNQSLGILKGVGENFNKIVDIDSTINDGRFDVGNVNGRDLALVGTGLSNSLMFIYDDRLSQSADGLTVYMAKRRESSGSLMAGKPFRSNTLYPTGSFENLQEFSNHALTNLAFVQDLLGYYGGEVSAVELKLKPGVTLENGVEAIAKVVPDSSFHAKDRYRQDEAFFKVTNMEKWITYAILCFVLVLIAFNMIGALSMLVVDKKKDIATFRAIGMNSTQVRNIFLSVGLLIGAVGTLVGFAIAIAFCLAQQQFGFITLPGEGELLLQAYPVEMEFADFVLVAITIMVIAGIASYIPASKAASTKGLIREE